MNGSQIVSEQWSDKLLVFLYDESGSPVGMQYRTNSMAEGTFYTYLFEKNLQGDIIAVYNTSGTKLISYVYDAWGNFRQTNHNISGTNAGAQYNPFTYRGYYCDTELGLYYLQSRYYDPFYGRFINADSYFSTGTGLLSYNVYAYCNNNPINYVDQNGMFWQEIGDFFKKIGTTISDVANVAFGAGATLVHQVAQETEIIPPIANLFVTYKIGTRESKIMSSAGDSSKPISVYAQGRSDNLLLSSAGLKINISNFTFDISLGLDNIGISGSLNKDDITKSFGVKANISQFKLGIETSNTVKLDETKNITSYNNVSVTGWGIYAAYIFATTGQWCPSPQSASN